MDDNKVRVKVAAMRAVATSAEEHKREALSCLSFSTKMPLTFLCEYEIASDVALSYLRTVDDDTSLMLEIFSEVYDYLLY